MKTIPATHFKTNCLSWLAHVARSRQSLIVTKRGKPLVKVAPVTNQAVDHAALNHKPLKGSVLYYGDVLSPIGVDWEAEKI